MFRHHEPFHDVDFLDVVLSVPEQRIVLSRAFLENLQIFFGLFPVPHCLGHLASRFESRQIQRPCHGVRTVKFNIVGVVLFAFHDSVFVGIPG